MLLTYSPRAYLKETKRKKEGNDGESKKKKKKWREGESRVNGREEREIGEDTLELNYHALLMRDRHNF